MCLLKGFLVCILVVSINGSPVNNKTTAETTTETTTEHKVDFNETKPFNAEEYKEALLHLECIEVRPHHNGIRIPEVQSGSIYKPTTTTSGYQDTKDRKEKKSRRSVNSDSTPPVPAVPPAENSTKEVNKTEVCTAPLVEHWDEYDWYQILLDNGGAPGAANITKPKPNLTKPIDPCSRPLQFESAQDDIVWYMNKTLQTEKRIYREETVYLRFPDTPREFLEISGLLVWSPPEEKHRSYHITYRKDDTGLYVFLDRNYRCHFTDPITSDGIKCEYTSFTHCTCENGEEVCMFHYPTTLSPSLFGALIGNGK